MSRSNAPAAQPGSWPPPQRPELDPVTGAPLTTGRPAAPGQPPQGYAPPAYPAQGYQPPQAPPSYAPQQAAPGTGQVYAPAPQSYAQPTHPQAYADPAAYGYQPEYHYPPEAAAVPATQPPTQQPATAAQGARSYAPRFDPYVPAAHPPHPPHAAPTGLEALPQYQPPQQPAYAHPAQPAAAPLQSPEQVLARLNARTRAPDAPSLAIPQPLPQDHAPPQFGGAPYAQPHDDWPATAGQPQRPAQGGLDLGGYHAGAYETPATAGQQQQHAAEVPYDQWPQASPAQGGYGQPGYAQAGSAYGGQGYPAQGGYAGQQAGYAGDLHMDHAAAASHSYAAQHAQPGALDAGPHDDADHEDYEDEEEAEPKRRGSLLMVAGALTAAVIVGGGLAYGYQKFMGKPVAEIATIKNQGQPAKAKPAEAGGKQFSHTDSKVMGRLTEGGTSSSAAGEDPNAPRKVVTIPVGRDGALTAPAPETPPPPVAAAAPMPTAPVSVPGMTVVDGFGGRAPIPAARPTPPAAQPVAVAPPPAPPAAAAKPVVVSRAAPAQDAAAVDDVPAAPAKKAALPKKKVVDAYGAAGSAVPAAGAAAPVASAPASSGAGFVAVLASVPATPKSRMDALKQFADMQQKYGGALGDKTPDVQEANLGAKGTYHRLMAGPPGSREQASSVCAQLKAAGYSGCWVTSY